MKSLTDEIHAYLQELAEAFSSSGQSVFTHEVQRWVVGNDGVARRQTVSDLSMGFFPHRFQEESKQYPKAVRAIADDPVFGQLLGSLIGDSGGSSRFDENTVLSQAMADMVGPSGQLIVSKPVVRAKIAALKKYVQAKERHCTVIIPLPGLKCSAFPFVLEKGVEIDHLTEEEIDACAQNNLLYPIAGSYPMLNQEECVGARVDMALPTVIIKSEDFQRFQENQLKQLTLESEKPHRFGERSRSHLPDLVEDVLFVLRLARTEYVGTAGGIALTKTHMGSSFSWNIRQTRQFLRSTYELDDKTGKVVKGLWSTLKAQGAKKHSLPMICQRRFNAAVDRHALDDSVIDHLIAAEALFLRDAGSPEDRGELGFRLSLRMSAFLKKAGYVEKDTFKFARRAYDLRSGLAHGGSLPKTIKVTGRSREVPVHEFVDELSNLMRTSLRRAVELYPSQKTFGTSEYWDSLLFTKSL